MIGLCRSCHSRYCRTAAIVETLNTSAASIRTREGCCDNEVGPGRVRQAAKCNVTKRRGFASVIAKLASPAAFDELHDRLASNPALTVDAERVSDYLLRSTGSVAESGRAQSVRRRVRPHSRGRAGIPFTCPFPEMNIFP